MNLAGGSTIQIYADKGTLELPEVGDVLLTLTQLFPQQFDLSL